MPIPSPTATETENEFIVRAHVALASEIPETDTRNAAIFSAWRQSRGEGDLESKAYSKFGESEYEHIRDVPIWAEHELSGRNGQPIKFDLSQLQAICDRCNYRIADTGDFSALTLGHTPTKEQRLNGVTQMPDVVGWSGPFRLGMVGNVNPRWAIFADEHHRKDSLEDIKRSPRRSPEVWLHPDPSKRFMDPIAALGADAPRLDLGTRYAMVGELEVERYAAVDAGAENAFVPGETSVPRRERYQEPTIQEPDMAISPEDVQTIIGALMETEPMKWVASQMQAANPQGKTEGEQPDTTAGTAPAVDPDKDKPDLVAQYSRLSSELEVMRAEKAALEARVGKAEADRRNVERYSRLSELRANYAFDLDKEAKRCGPLSDEQFAEHCDSIVENYSRIGAGEMIRVPGLERPEAARTETEKQRYARSTVDEAVRIVQDARDRGENPSFNEVLAQVQSKKKS